MNSKNMANQKRIKICFYLIFSCFVLILIRLVYLQVINYKFFREKANIQQVKFKEIEPPRAIIFDRNKNELAINIKALSIYICPNEFSERDIPLLSKITGVSESLIKKKVSDKKKKFVWLVRKTDPKIGDKIKELNIKGVNFIYELKRYYPNAKLASHILGFTGIDGNGLEGVEYYYDKVIRGNPYFTYVKYDGLGKPISTLDKEFLPSSIILTIDKDIQYIVESELEKVFISHKPKWAVGIVMDPKTGEVLALANYPTFDPNRFNEFSKEILRNKAITDLFEPGSTFKIVTLVSALKENKNIVDEKIFCENGEYELYGHKIHDVEKYKFLSFPEVFIYSSNIGVIKIAMKIGLDTILKYAEKLGFNEKTGIDLPGESKWNLYKERLTKSSIASIPIGQEISTTAIQLITSYCCIANGGNLIKPRIVKFIYDQHGKIIYSIKPQVKENVITKEDAQKITQILKGVVEYGTGKLAKIDGLSIAGKTGTAQKFDVEENKYSDTKYIASFIGYFPAEDPKFVILVIINEPIKEYYGGQVAASVFKNIAKRILRIRI
jgi:cell division protein FtsI (penicillin-binding protein 3)